MTASGARSTARQPLRFAVGNTTCAAWHYPGANGACVVMAGGLGVTKEPGTDPFAQRFHAAGFSVLAFDYRGFGESGGEPRQVARIGDQLEDWRAALAYARTLDEVDPARVAVWGFSLSGGHVFRIAASDDPPAAAIAHSALADGQVATRNALRHTTPLALLRLTGRGVLDALGALAGRAPRLVPLAGERGSVAALTTPDARTGSGALDPDGRYPEWEQTVAARSAVRIGFYRPGRCAARTRCPLLVVVHADDGAALPGPAARAACRAPQGELVELPGGHYAAFMELTDAAAELQLEFLRRHLLPAD